MSMTSGQSIFGFFGRVAGTAVAMVTSIIIWYIVNQHTAGIIVFLWLFIFLEMYFFLKFPRFLPIFLISIVTQVLIVGYELQVKKIGLAACKSATRKFKTTSLIFSKPNRVDSHIIREICPNYSRTFR